MAKKLSSSQQAQLAFLQALPPQFDRFHRKIEEMAVLHLDETQIRALTRQFDQLKNQASGLSLGALGETFGVMAMLARRGGGMQMKVRGLREALGSLKVNYDGALRAASTPAQEEPDPSSPAESA